MIHRSRRIYIALLIVLSLFLIVSAEIVHGDVVQISPSQDNTLYEDLQGDVSNGAGWYIFVGRTGQLSDYRRRALIAFDLTGSIPDSSTIQSVSLTLHLSNEPPGGTAHEIILRTVLSGWGEGTSNALGAGGGGAVAAANDATWLHQFFDFDTWAAAGGDFAGTTSGSITVDNIGTYTVASTAQMVADVQSWLDDPANNFGWLLLGTESISSTAKRFDSRENPTVANRPVLTVTFLPPPCCVGIGGDVNNDGVDGDIFDLNYMVNDIFRGGPASPCPKEADFDNNGTPSAIIDLNFIVNIIFRGGPPAAACQ